MTFVVFPEALEVGAISPCHNTIAVPLASLEVALILSLLKLGARAARQAIVVLEHAIAISSTVLERTSQLISILVVDFTQPETNVNDSRVSKERIFVGERRAVCRGALFR